MKAMELVNYLIKNINETGFDSKVYFDTEAASFDFHLVEISHVEQIENIPDGEETIILKCDNNLYNHTRCKNGETH